MLEIRSLTHDDDLAAVGDLCAESWKQTYQRILPQAYLDRLTRDRWSAVLSANPSAWVGLFENGVLIGTAMLGFPRQEGREDCGEIVLLHLSPQKEGMGHGRRLLEGCLDQLRENGFEQACLWVICANTHAIFFYMHMGFKPTGRVHQESYGGEEVELMEMTMSLN